MTGISKAETRQRIFVILNNHLIHVLIICLLGLIVYSNAFHVPFQWDEGHFIRDNPVVKDFGYFLDPSAAPAQFYGALVGRYIGYLTFALNYKIGGFNVTGYHVFNLAVHILNALLVYILVVLTFRTPYFSNKQSAVSGRQDERDDTPPSSPLRHNPPFSPLNLRGDERGLRFNDSRSLIAFFAALLFVSHPLQIEAVTYIFQRLASLAAMFYLLSIVMYIKARLRVMGKSSPDSPLKVRGDKGGVRFNIRDSFASRLSPVVFYFLSMLFAVFAMKTKENAFTLPIIIILYEFLFFEGTAKVRAIFLLPLSLTSLIIPVTLYMSPAVTAKPFDTSSIAFRNIPRWDYFITQARVIVTYIRLIFLPFNQDVDYDYPVFHSLPDPAVLFSVIFLFSLAGIAVYLLWISRGRGAGSDNPPLSPLGLMVDEGGIQSDAERTAADDSQLTAHGSGRYAFYFRLIAFGILWFFITLSVESSLQPLPQVIDEYRMYLPMAGVAMAVVAGLFLLAEKFRGRKMRIAIICLPVFLAIILSGASYHRNSVWETKVSLWKDAAAKSPRKASAHINLGTAYEEGGEIGDAIRQYQSALRINPFYTESYYNLCIACSKNNSPDMAIRYCRTAVSLYPDRELPHYYLALMYLQKGLADDARNELEIALQISPGFYQARQLLDDITAQTGY